MASKDLKQLRTEAAAKGWVIEPTNGGHYKWKSPDGKTIFFTSATPSDYRAIRNIAAQVRKAEAGESQPFVLSKRDERNPS